jgi:hypothetical protein
MTEVYRAIGSNLTLLVLTLIVAIIVSFAEMIVPKHRLGQAYRASSLVSFVSTLSFGMLGITIGYLSGLSRESVVGAVLPAVLSLVAGVAVLAMGKKLYAHLLVSKAVFALSFMLLLGATIGAERRETFFLAQTDARLRSLLDFEFQMDLAVREARVRAFRSQFDLSPEPVDITGYEAKPTKKD